MTFSNKIWTELKDGFGLDEVPRHLSRVEDGEAEIACCMCGRPWPGIKLYSQWVATYETATTQKQIQDAVAKLRGDSYCRYHAERMFGPRD